MLIRHFFVLIVMALSTYVNAFAVSEKKTPHGQVYWAYHVPDVDFLTFMITFPLDNAIAKTKNGSIAI
ncbi:MAG: hypothetical protein Q8K36_06880, partial [Alphaproteobacteria bacterium]|nr:hypothetical protein [Alphaproteobacteria bacterium]